MMFNRSSSGKASLGHTQPAHVLKGVSFDHHENSNMAVYAANVKNMIITLQMHLCLECGEKLSHWPATVCCLVQCCQAVVLAPDVAQ